MLIAPTYQLGPITMNFMAGDILNTNEATFGVVNAGANTYVGGDLVRGDIRRSGNAGAAADVFPTSDDLVKSLAGSLNGISPPSNALYGTLAQQTVQLAWPANLMPFIPGSSFRRTIINTNGGTITHSIQASTGASLSGTTTILTNVWREFLIRILNSSPATTVSFTTTNATLTLTNGDPLLVNNITTGMSVYGTNIGAAAVVTGVNRDTGTVSVSVASTGTANNIGVSFTPTVVFEGLRSGPI